MVIGQYTYLPYTVYYNPDFYYIYTLILRDFVIHLSSECSFRLRFTLLPVTKHI